MLHSTVAFFGYWMCTRSLLTGDKCGFMFQSLFWVSIYPQSTPHPHPRAGQEDNKCKSSTAALPDCKNRWNFNVSDRRWGACMRGIKEIEERIRVWVYGEKRRHAVCLCVCVFWREILPMCVLCADIEEHDIFMWKKQRFVVLLFLCVCLFVFSTAVCSRKNSFCTPADHHKMYVSLNACVCSLLYVTSASRCDEKVWLAFDESLLFQLLLTSLFSPTLFVLTILFLFSPPSLIHPSISTPCSVSTLWIIQACRASVFLVVVTSAVTQTKPILASTHTYTLTHAAMPARRFTQTRNRKVSDSVRPLRLAKYEELSLQGFHTITVLHPVSAPLSRQWIITCLTYVSSTVTQSLILKKCVWGKT